MNAVPSDRLFDLLPAVIRAADAGRRHPLRDLLRVIGEEALLLDADIRQMYENLFIETCEPWVVAYLGDLVGFASAAEAPVDDGFAGGSGSSDPRRAVANRIALNRRKGTVSALDDLVAQTTGWAARVKRDRGGPLVVGIRIWRFPSWPLTRVRPFYHPRGVNCFSFSVLGNDAPLHTRADPEPDDEEITAERRPPRRISVHMLAAGKARLYGPGRSLCIYENGQPVDARRVKVRDLSDWSTHLSRDQVAVDPVLGRMMFRERHRPKTVTASYHQGFSAAIGGGEYPRQVQDAIAADSLFRRGHLAAHGVTFLETLRGSARAFSEWLRDELDDDVLAMPLDDAADVERRLTAELNRLLQRLEVPDAVLDSVPFAPELAQLKATDPQGPRRIRLNRLILEAAFPDAIHRSVGRVSVVSGRGRTAIMDAVRSLQQSAHPPMTMIVELTDSGLYVEPVIVHLPEYRTLILRAAEGCRPTIVLPDRRDDVDDLVISCERGSRVVLDGLMVSRRAVRVVGNPRSIRVRHCTFVPGWELDARCRPRWGTEASLVLSDIPLPRSEDVAPLDVQPPADDGCPPEPLAPTDVCIDRSIVGTILVQRDEVDADPIRLEIRRSIVDATSRNLSAIAAPGDRRAQAIVSVDRSTVIGRVRTHAIGIAEDSIFTGRMDSARRQVGCLRYCYVPPRSRTPKRFACQPDLAIAAATAAGRDPDAEAARVSPRFLSRRYGRPDYGRLDDAGADAGGPEIRRGAEDGSEMGVFNELRLEQRLDALRLAMAEFLPLGWTWKMTDAT